MIANLIWGCGGLVLGALVVVGVGWYRAHWATVQKVEQSVIADLTKRSP